ncbi:MAG: CotH kinase family protein [Pseudomonadota bacterium]
MKPLNILVFVAASLLSGCGGGGGADSGGTPAPPPGGLSPVVFKDLTGTTPADAELGQPFTVQWVLPAGANITAVTLDATALSGTSPGQTSCVVSAGALPATATSATMTIPNSCASKTVREVQLKLTVDAAGGQRTTATHVFTAPGVPAAFLPQHVALPVLRITTDNGAPIVSKDVYITGQMNLASTVAGEAAVIGGLQIRGRGNSTWDMPKKPYRLKLTDKQSLLGLPSSRDWVLLANYSDKTLLRNALALDLGTKLGLPWSPRSAYVEVYLNGRYDGVYQLMENIKVAKDRVNIDELALADVGADKITGGYLLEVDFRQDGHTMFSAVDHLPIVFQSPEEPAPAQETYIKGYVDEFETVLHSSGFADPATGYAAYIDVDSFVRWYLVNEVFRNVDANMWTSCWMFKPRGGKLHMGPLWDFDLGAGNVNYEDAFKTDGWRVRTGPWFSRLFEDPAFAARVKLLWNEIKNDELAAMLQSIPVNAAKLQQPQLNNFQRWPILEMYVWPNYMIPGSYAGEIAYLDTWLEARIAWLDRQFNP